MNVTMMISPPFQPAYQHGKSSSGGTHQHPVLECLKTKHFSHFSNFAPNKFSVDFGPTVDGIVIKPYFKVRQFLMHKWQSLELIWLATWIDNRANFSWRFTWFQMSKDSMGKRDLVKKYDLLFGVSSLEKMTEFSEVHTQEGFLDFWRVSLPPCKLGKWNWIFFPQADLTFGFEAQRRDAILRTVIRNSYRFHLNEILATVVNEYTDWERS